MTNHSDSTVRLIIENFPRTEQDLLIGWCQTIDEYFKDNDLTDIFKDPL